MRKVFLIAQREFMENARTKSFWIGIIIFPVMLGLFFIVPALLDRTKSARQYAVVDESGWLLEAVDQELLARDMVLVFRTAAERYREADSDTARIAPPLAGLAPQLAPLDETQLAAAARRLVDPADTTTTDSIPNPLLGTLERERGAILAWWRSLDADGVKEHAPGSFRKRYARVTYDGAIPSLDSLGHLVANEKLFAYFVIGSDPVTGSEGSRYISNNLTDDDLPEWFGRLASAEVRAQRLKREQIDQRVAQWIQTPIRFEARKVSGEGEEEAVEKQDQLRQWVPVVFVYLLWISIFTITQMLITNTIEEKSNRIIEVLLSSVSPVELMAGKILGIAITGLTIVGSWMVFFYLGTKYVPAMLGAPPTLDLSALASDPLYVGSFIMYFLLGYLLFAALLVGIGSVCTTLKEAQNLMGPVTLLLIVPLMAMVPIGKDPNGTLAQVMSFIPPFTPFVMMNRAAAPPSTLEYILTTALLVVSIAVTLWAAAKVFRIGILLTGKPPKIKEILRWIRAPIGVIPQRR